MMKTFKKVLNYGIASTTLIVADAAVVGVDSTALGQTGPGDANVPTGSVIKAIRVQAGFGNQSTTVAMHVGVNMQYQLGGQATVLNPLAQGGSTQRNQVIKSWMFVLAPLEHRNIDVLIKIPKKFQRVREGMQWKLVHDSAGVSRTYATQMIVKVRS